MKTESADRAKVRRIPMYIRVFVFAVPMTITVGVFLGVTGYPVEGWPFVSGVFVVALYLSSTLVTWLVLVIGRRLIDYGRLVLTERGVDVDSMGSEVQVPRIPLIVLTICAVLLVAGTVWGLAINGLVVVLDRTTLPPLAAGLPGAADIMFLVGACGLALGMTFHFALFYSLRRMEQHMDLVSAISRFVFSAARIGEGSVLIRRLAGFPVRIGTG